MTAESFLKKKFKVQFVKDFPFVGKYDLPKIIDEYVESNKLLNNINHQPICIKIESENDLPKEKVDCWFYDKKKGWVAGQFLNNGKDEIDFILENATHYQVIIKPNNPK